MCLLQTVEDALNAGPERFTNRDRDEVLKAMRAVRLDPALAKEILTETVKSKKYVLLRVQQSIQASRMWALTPVPIKAV